MVSVIMPAYNVENFIEEAIKSVQTQTYTNWELVVVDDGSTDNTAEIIKKLVKKDNRIHYLFQKRGRQGKARNLAIKNSSGKYIAFLDADDLWASKKLQIQVTTMEGRPDLDLIFTQGFNLFPGGDTTEVNVEVKEWTWKQDRDLFVKSNQIPILSTMVRRKAIEDVACFSENHEMQNGAEDYHLWIKLLKNGRFLSIEKRLFYYRIHENQVTYQTNTALAITTCLADLVFSGVISNEDEVVKSRLKALIFPNPDLTRYFEILKTVFPQKKRIINLLLVFNKLVENTKFVKKVAFHIL